MPDAPHPLGVVLREARRRLSEAGVAGAALDARLLVEHFTGTTRSQAITDPTLPVHGVEPLFGAVERRIAGEPLHRILGFREFYGLKLELSRETLEPRPDTETLVDAVLPFVREVSERRGGCRVLDLGTGTGAILLAVLSVCPKASGWGVDISADAVATATRNADQLGLSNRFSVIQSNWFEKISNLYDVIVSNPPYVSSQQIEGLQQEVRYFDPVRALDGGADGLDHYRIIAERSPAHLAQGGLIALEIGHDQKADVTVIFVSHGWNLVEALADLGGNDRVLLFARP
ncbi:peptide chain release factor N(5)-glutamine methyltransferase [Corticibacterium sp. UT-5YL-CI-8]|nr:peptide chain release factor N(5)-glutamine methyltransferase [Tianweitania sp. UT-5YL-CI-8]